MQIFDIHFFQDFYFYTLFLVALFLYFYLKIQRKDFVFMKLYKNEKKLFSGIIFYLKLILVLFILFIFITIFSDPYKLNIKEKINKNWVDIVLVLDVSKSMDALDLSPSRIEKSKQMLYEFVSKQKTNRVWLVIFSWAPLVWVPLSFDYDILTESIKNLDTNSLDSRFLDWTAIWDALLLAKNLFETKDEKIKDRQKIIILLTDWDANKWSDPLLVAELLKKESIKIYSVWIWSKKGWFIKLNNGFFEQQVAVAPLKVDSLKLISKKTKGYFFRAWDDENMEKIFDKLQQLEKNDIKVEINKNFKETYYPFVYLILVFIFTLFLLEIRKFKA